MNNRTLKFPEQAKKAVNEFVKLLLEKDKDKIRTIVLYGSAINGKYKSGESDIDIMVISDDRKIDDDILEFETKISLKYGVMLSVLLNSLKEIKKIQKMGYQFIRDVQKGEILYGSI